MALVRIVAEPRIHARLRSEFSLSRSDDRESFVASGGPLVQPAPVGPYRAAFEDSNRLLCAGAPLAALRDAVLAHGDAEPAALYLLWLQRLSSWGLVEFPIVEGGQEHCVVVPQWPSFVPSLSADEVPCTRPLDRFACLRRQDGSWVLESPLAGARFVLADLDALDRPIVRRALRASGFLEPERPLDDPRGTALAQWEFHDLLFHCHHRVGWHRDPIGGLFPFIGEIDPLPARRPDWPGTRFPLAPARPSSRENSFSAVLERRRSERFYDAARPITVEALGALLDRAARIRNFETIEVQNVAGRRTPFEISRRPYPNGGASYELEIYPIVAHCQGLDPGVYHYDAAEHHLVRISGPGPDIDRMFAENFAATAYMARPQVVLAIAARFARVTWKYRAIAYGVILRNTGALYQTLYLAATELNLSPCGIGSGHSELFARITGLDPVVEGTVGEFILGGAPRSS